MNSCGGCEYHDQSDDCWIKWCSVIKNYICVNTTERCSRYQSIWRVNLFGETRYRELIDAGLIKDATGYYDAIDLRPEMAKHPDISSQRIKELSKPNKVIVNK